MPFTEEFFGSLGNLYKSYYLDTESDKKSGANASNSTLQSPFSLYLSQLLPVFVQASPEGEYNFQKLRKFVEEYRAVNSEQIKEGDESYFDDDDTELKKSQLLMLLFWKEIE